MMGEKQTRWPKHLEDEVVEVVMFGKSIKEWAKERGINYTTVRQKISRLRNSGIIPPTPDIKARDRLLIKMWNVEHKTSNEIAVKFGMSTNGVNRRIKYLRSLGVVMLFGQPSIRRSTYKRMCIDDKCIKHDFSWWVRCSEELCIKDVGIGDSVSANNFIQSIDIDKRGQWCFGLTGGETMYCDGSILIPSGT